MDFLRRLGIQQHHVITVLHYTTLVTTFLQTVFQQSVKTTYSIIDSFKPDVYCFFSNQYVAVKQADYNLSTVTCPRVAYFYEKDSGFYRNGVQFSTARLNLLSAHLYHHNLRVADLSDFFYSTTFEAGEGIPQLGYWIGAWQLKNRIFLDVSKQFTIHFTTILGDRVVIDYEPSSEQCQNQWTLLNRDVRHMNERDSEDDYDSSDEEEEEEEQVNSNPNPASSAAVVEEASQPQSTVQEQVQEQKTQEEKLEEPAS